MYQKGHLALKILEDVKEVYDRYGRCVIAVSEGVQDEKGVAITKLVENVEKDAHGNVHLGGGALGELLAEEIKRILILKG